MIGFLMIVFVRTLLWLRYRVSVRGLDEVKRKGKKGILFLPNHPGLIDPIILLSRLYGPFRVRALADRDQIDRFFIRWLARLIRVLPIPDLAKTGSSSAQRVQEVLRDCVEVLRQGDNLVLYPAGRTYRKRFEDIGSNSAVESILHELPNVRVVLVRTRGLWGSRFSRAWGEEPELSRVLRKGIFSLLVSGIFFAPRRRVAIELVEPDDLPRRASRVTINRYLEEFYNNDAPGNTYVPYTIWERGTRREVPEPELAHMGGDLYRVPSATRQIVHDYLRELTGENNFDDDARLAHDLGMDSLSMVEMLTWLESEFGFPQGNVDSLRTVGDVMLAAFGEAATEGWAKVVPPLSKWYKPGSVARPEGLAGMSITQAFLAQAKRGPSRVAVADQASGVKTYRDLIMAVLALRRTIEDLPGDRVGIMMPASVGANVLYLSTLFAGKTPVMANWTLGRQSLQHCLDSVGAECVLTARELVTRIESHGIDLSSIRDRFVFVEDVAAQLSRWTKLRAWFGSRFSWTELRRSTASSTAVILFTSGSESLPKAVPLSHRNILTNVSDLFDCVTLRDEDSLLGILPPFHSFGLTSSIVLPLCLGLRAVYYPDPTNGNALAQMVDAYKATMLIGTPTFLNGIMRASGKAELNSLRLAVSGAEKCPQHVYERLARRCPQAVVLEGYGITECSPVVSVNREDRPQPGTVGQLMPSLQQAIVDPETGRCVEPGQPGMLLVRGPSVFDGYLIMMARHHLSSMMASSGIVQAISCERMSTAFYHLRVG